MNNAYSALFEQLRKPLVCPEHALPDCEDCVQAWIDFQNDRLVSGFEELLAKVAAQDSVYEVEDVGDDNDPREYE